MKSNESLPGFRPELMTEPMVQHLFVLVELQARSLEQMGARVEALEAEIRRLKKLPRKPNIKASRLDENPKNPNKNGSTKKGKKGLKRKKKENLEIHETEKVKLDGIPEGWRLVGYKSRVIQDIIVRANNIEYQLEVWKSADGKQTMVAKMPDHLENTHFGAMLKAYIIHQYFECAVTQPLILSSLRDYGVDISSGQINAILTENKDRFHSEKADLLSKGIEIGEELRTDDTGARHEFKNGYCNCINSDLFTFFSTSYTKSRINFLEILRGDRTDYHINEACLSYAKAHSAVTPRYYERLKQKYDSAERVFEDKSALEAYFTAQGITAKYPIKLLTQAMLIGTIVEHGFDPKMVIHSDGAEQFNLFIHSLCWKHAERPLVKLKCYNPLQEQNLKAKQKAYWLLYRSLQDYKENPDEKTAIQLSQTFDSVCEPVENYASLNQVLDDLKKKKDQLLVVLHRPNTSLHNNNTESDIREYVKRRKISAGTRSENGRKARDTFLSLKKTCRKLGISFWEYLLDRLENKHRIPTLSQVMVLKAALAR